MNIPTKTKNAMNKLASTLAPGSQRAQCYTIANYKLSTTIAARLLSDHSSVSDAKRAALLMVEAGCAKEINAKSGMYGDFVFQDLSILN